MNLSAASSEKIANLLKTSGVLTADRFTKIANQCGANKEKIVDELLKKKFVSEQDIVKVVAKAYNLKTIDLKIGSIKPDGLSALPVDFIRKEKIVPIGVEANQLKLAIADPAKLIQLAKIKNFAKKNVNFSVTTFTNLEKVLADKVWDAQKAKAKNGKGVPGATKPKKPINLAPMNVVEVVDKIFQDSLAGGTSDIHIEQFKDGFAQVRFREDGIMKVHEELSSRVKTNYIAVVTRLKIMAGCDISENRLPQDGAITVKDRSNNNVDCDVRFNVVPTKFGERVCMRLLRGTNIMALDQIGIPDRELKVFIKSIEAPQGMVLVTGPTGSGKTTTLYAALAHLNKPEKNILTAEDPVEYTLPGIGQIQANEGIGLSFANILKAFLRQDPEVILVGEIRDKSTVDIAIKAAITGHLLLSTLHTNDAIQTIVRMTNMGVPAVMIAGALNTIVAQRLARKICQKCKVEDTSITPEQLKEIGFNVTEVESLKIYKGAGCEACKNTGYKGRQGIYEVLESNTEFANGIIANLRAPELLEIARKNGFRTMEQIARDHMRNGIITYAEFVRNITLAET